MKRLLYRWIALVVSIVIAAFVTGRFVEGFSILIDSAVDFLGIFLGAAALAIVNATLGKLLKVLTLPLNCLTLGLFSLVVNAAMLYLVGQFQLGFYVQNFWAALVGSVLISVINALLGMLIPDDEKEKN